MQKKIYTIIGVCASLWMLSACGGDDDTQKISKPTVIIDESHLQNLSDINDTTHVCSLGDELVKDGNASDFNTSVDQTTLEWKMTLNTDKIKDLRVDKCKINTGEERLCFQVNPEKPGTGMYQEIVVEIEKRYRVQAELIGADNVDFKNDFTRGGSYVSIEDAQPEETSKPLAYSKEVIGNTPTKVAFDFNATQTNMYVQLRGTKEFAYPTAFYISVRELILNKSDEIEDNSTTVPCNLK